MLALFLSLLLSQSSDITLVVNNNQESKILISEINRDWKETVIPFEDLHQDTKNRIEKYNEISKAIKHRIKIVDVSKTTIDNFKYSNFSNYPVLLYSFSSKPIYFDNRAFKHPSFGILYINSIILEIEYNHNDFLQDIAYNKKRIIQTNQELITTWLDKNLPDEHFFFIKDNAVYCLPVDIECYDCICVEQYTSRFEHYDGFPTLLPEFIPIEPKHSVPWELKLSSKQYKFLPVMKIK